MGVKFINIIKNKVVVLLSGIVKTPISVIWKKCRFLSHFLLSSDLSQSQDFRRSLMLEAAEMICCVIHHKTSGLNQCTVCSLTLTVTFVMFVLS